jgi:hypothetical protein
VTLTIPAAMTSLVATTQIAMASAATPVSDLALETHPPKPYDIVQGMECIIGIMEDTLQICERAQRSMQMASRQGTFPFGLRPPSDAYARQAIKSSQIQSGQRRPSSDLKPELRTNRDPLDISCTYDKGAQHTLHGYILRKKISQEWLPRTTLTPTSPNGGDF